MVSGIWVLAAMANELKKWITSCSCRAAADGAVAMSM